MNSRNSTPAGGASTSSDPVLYSRFWIAHTHLMDVWESTPRMAFLSPEPGSGKTRALEVTELLVPRPVSAVNATPAYLVRKISDKEGTPTILSDEIDRRAQSINATSADLGSSHRGCCPC
jgi:hypothetical protein